MADRPRVAILGPAPPDRGGIARETRRLYEALSAGAETSWLTYSRRYPRWLDPRRFDVDPGLPSAGAIPSLDYRSPGSWRRTASTIADFAPDALLAIWWTSFWGFPYRALFRELGRRAPRTARVLLCHNVTDHEGGVARRFLALGAFSAADAFVVHSGADRESLVRREPGKPVLFAPHPVAPAAPTPRAEARRRLSLEPDEPLALFLGLVRVYKGVDLLIDAAPALARELGARIAVVGEVFPEARDLARRVASSPAADRILWKDEYVPESEMDLWLSASDVVVLPYRAVSGSGIAARAFAAGRPVAAAAVGGLKDVVEPGVTGELFPPGDSAALASAVVRVLAHGPGHYAAGLSAAAERASWPRYTRALLEFVASLASEGRRRKAEGG